MANIALSAPSIIPDDTPLGSISETGAQQIIKFYNLPINASTTSQFNVYFEGGALIPKKSIRDLDSSTKPYCFLTGSINLGDDFTWDRYQQVLHMLSVGNYRLNKESSLSAIISTFSSEKGKVSQVIELQVHEVGRLTCWSFSSAAPSPVTVGDLRHAFGNYVEIFYP